MLPLQAICCGSSELNAARNHPIAPINLTPYYATCCAVQTLRSIDAVAEQSLSLYAAPQDASMMLALTTCKQWTNLLPLILLLLPAQLP